MTMKITAITVSASVGLLSVLATLFPNDLYFFFISSNVLTVIARLFLCGVLVYLTLINQFHTVYGPKIAMLSGIFLMLFGLSGIVVMPVTYDTFNYLKPMDFVFMIGVGNILAYAGLSYQPGTNRLELPRLSRPRHSQLRLFSPRSA